MVLIPTAGTVRDVFRACFNPGRPASYYEEEGAIAEGEGGVELDTEVKRELREETVAMKLVTKEKKLEGDWVIQQCGTLGRFSECKAAWAELLVCGTSALVIPNYAPASA